MPTNSLLSHGDPVLVALSGGVDSAVAALILQQQGFTVAGVTLKTFCYAEIPGGPKSCCGLEGIDSARAVAARLGIPHLVLDVTERFKTDVIDDFVREYALGRTPNPCVVCNATVKIPYLLEYARRIGYKALATGHYARILPAREGGWALHRGLDSAKDQSYFLWQIPRAILKDLLFPIGELTKSEVRKIAESAGLSNAQRPESQEICFVPDGDYVAFLRKMLPADHIGFRPGYIIDSNGKRIGEHRGYLNYTIGQRRGLGGGHGRRLFVIGLNTSQALVIAGEESELFGKSLELESINLLADLPFAETTFQIQIRHRAKPIPGRLHRISATSEGSATTSEWLITLDQPARAITPGQSAVLYLEDRVVAGGRISNKVTTTKTAEV